MGRLNRKILIIVVIFLAAWVATIITADQQKKKSDLTMYGNVKIRQQLGFR